MATLREKLYQLWVEADQHEVYEAFRKSEAERAIKQRDLLLALLPEGIKAPDADCRHCGAPMPMKPWAEQFCHICKGD